MKTAGINNLISSCGCVDFYPRPLVAISCCRCLRLCVCLSVCVCQSRACPCGNSPVQVAISKFGSEVHSTLVENAVISEVNDLLESQIFPNSDPVHELPRRLFTLNFQFLTINCNLVLLKSLSILGLIDLQLHFIKHVS